MVYTTIRDGGMVTIPSHGWFRVGLVELEAVASAVDEGLGRHLQLRHDG